MNLLESILYGLVSGLSEFLPISTQAHQAIFMRMFGVSQRDPLRDLLVHSVLLLALLVSCRSLLSKISREQRLSAQIRRSRHRRFESRSLYDLRLVKAAAVPMLIVLLLYVSTAALEFKPIYISVFLILNGIVLLLPEHMPHGNKDARSLSGLDGIVMGVVSALSVLPGFSRVGASISYGTARGADRTNCLNWALLLSIPALILFLLFDIWGLFTIGVGTVTFLNVVGYFLSAAAAFAGGYFGILSLRFLADKTGFAGFAYYSWGAALFNFILYLIA